MNESDGVVVRVDGDYAWVRVAGPGQACGACASRSACATADAALGGAAPQLLRLPNPIQARPGDAVVIRAADGAVLRAIWHAYGVPLLLAMAAALGLFELTGSEAGAALGLLLGLGGGFLLLRRRRAAAHGEPILSIGFKNVF